MKWLLENDLSANDTDQDAADERIQKLIPKIGWCSLKLEGIGEHKPSPRLMLPPGE